jgi:WD40 repeat protein
VHAGGVTALAADPAGIALCGAGDGYLHCWDIFESECLFYLAASVRPVRSLVTLPGGHHALVGSFRGSLKLWDLRSKEYLRGLQGHQGDVTALALLPDGRRVLSAAEDGPLRLWELTVRRVRESTRGLWAQAFDDDPPDPDDWVVVDKWEGQCLHTFAGHAGAVNALAVLPDGRRALSGSDDRTLRLWALEEGRSLAVFPFDQPVASLAFSALLCAVVVGLADGSVLFFRLEEPTADAPPRGVR